MNGSVNPSGSAVTDCHFDWGTSTAYGNTAPCAPAPGSGTSAVPVSAGLSGLIANTTYHFRVVASNAGGTSFGGDQIWTTVPNPPDVATQPASGVTQSAATLNGSVNPSGTAVTDCHFDWGTSTAYGAAVPCAPSPGSGTSAVPVSAALAGLTAGTTYHFRVVATNATGTSVGADQALTAAAPPSASAAQPPAVQSSSGALFSALVNPEGLTTAAYFEFGLDSQLRAASGVVYDQQTPAQVIGSDFASHSVTASVSGLLPNATYHVRVVAFNGAGTVTGPDQAFKTAADPPPRSPVLGKQFNVVPVSGLVFIKLPAGKSLRASRAAAGGEGSWSSALASAAPVKGQGFVPLTEARQIPIGSTLDTRLGVVKLVTASGVRRKTYTGDFQNAIFKVLQSRSRRQRGLTELRLDDSALPRGKGYAQCVGKAQDMRARSTPGLRARTALSSRAIQRLRAKANGRFRTRGRYSAATVRGTEWDTVDRCDGTLTHVKRGVVIVTDFRRRVNITVRAGASYLAKP
jgi:hypothetical protein